MTLSTSPRTARRRAAVAPLVALLGTALGVAACSKPAGQENARSADSAARSAQHAPPTAVATARAVVVHKSPLCDCCAKWVDHMRARGFDVTVHDTADVTPVKAAHGVTAQLASCHTALVGGYVVEGHVPAGDVQLLLRERPAVAGLAAPGMPMGSPGMEMPGMSGDRYDVVAFDRSGATRVFASH